MRKSINQGKFAYTHECVFSWKKGDWSFKTKCRLEYIKHHEVSIVIRDEYSIFEGAEKCIYDGWEYKVKSMKNITKNTSRVILKRGR